MNVHLFNDIKDGTPEEKNFVIAMNYEDGWEQLAYFDKGKFWIAVGPLKGQWLPFVLAWRYVTDDKKSPMERGFENN